MVIIAVTSTLFNSQKSSRSVPALEAVGMEGVSVKILLGDAESHLLLRVSHLPFVGKKKKKNVPKNTLRYITLLFTHDFYYYYYKQS